MLSHHNISMKNIYCLPAVHSRFFLLICFLFMTSHLVALDYYWVNGSGNWSEYATHWAKIPNPTGASDYHANIPTSDDDVIFWPSSSVITSPRM